MAKSRMPDPLRRRHLLETELPPAESRAVADAYLAEGRSLEALAFLAKAGDRDRIRAICDEAVAEGDAFLLREASLLLGEEPGAERWRSLAAAARAAGKESYAVDAARQAARGGTS
jgi:hypothetical protein